MHLSPQDNKAMMLAIYNGNVEFIKNFEYPLERMGVLAKDSVKQLQLFIVSSCTLCCHLAALRNVDVEFVFSLSDYYIQLSQSITDVDTLKKMYKNIGIHFTQIIHDHLAIEYPLAIQEYAQYISDNLYSAIKIEDVAKHFHMTPSYFSKLFKREMGQNIKDFIHSSKIKEAKNLMLYTEMSITEIAIQLGYSDSSHFSNICKKYTGKTPMELKQDISRNPLQQ